MRPLGRSEGVVEVALLYTTSSPHRVAPLRAPTWAPPVAHAHGIISPHILYNSKMQNTNVRTVRSKKNDKMPKAKNVTRQNG